MPHGPEIMEDETLTSTTLSTSASETDSDILDAFLRNYTVDFVPASACLKLRKRAGGSFIGLNWFPWGAPASGSFKLVVKPEEKGSHPWLHKLEIAPQAKRLRLSTAKRTVLGFLVARAWADYDWDTGRYGLNWKVTTKWNIGLGRTSRKERVALPQGTGEVRALWNIRAFLPEVEGHLGADQRGEAVHVEQGYCHVTVPRVELLLHLDDRRQPPEEVASSPLLEMQALDSAEPSPPSSLHLLQGSKDGETEEQRAETGLPAVAERAKRLVSRAHGACVSFLQRIPKPEHG